MYSANKKQVIRGFFWKFGERIIALGMAFVITLVLSRILSPKEYGEVALALIVINIADIFVSAGLGNSLIQKKDANDIDFSSALILNIIISIIIYVVIFVTAPSFSKLFQYEDLCLVIRVLCLKIPISSVNSIQQAYVSKTMQFKKFFFSTLFGSVISGSVGIVMAINNGGVWSLVLQTLLNTLIDTIVLRISIEWRPIFCFDRKRVFELLRYGWKLMVSGALDAVYNQIRNLVIGKRYSAETLAFYTNGTQYPQAATSAINSSISSVLFPTLSQEQDSVVKVKEITRQAIKVSSYLLWPIMFIIFVISPTFISLILTDKWLPCVPYIRIACISYGFWPIHTANLEALKATGHSDIFLKLEVIKCCLAFCILLISMKYGVMAIAASSILTSITSCVINSYPNKIILKYGYKEQTMDILPSFLKGIMITIVGILLTRCIENKIILLISQIIICVIMYLILSILCKDNNLVYLKKIMENRQTKNE